MYTNELKKSVQTKEYNESWIEARQLNLLSMLITHPDAFNKARTILKPEYFDDTLHAAAAYILDYHAKTGMLPATEQIKAQTSAQVTKFSEPNMHTAGLLMEVEAFCQYKAMEFAVLDGVEHLQTGKSAQILADVQASLAITLDDTPVVSPWVFGDEVEDVQPPVYLAAPWIVKDTVTAVFGAPGSFKSFWCLDLSLCLALGLPFGGAEVQRTPVLYLAAEGQGGVSMRVAAWQTHHGQKLARKDFALFTMPINLLDTAAVNSFIDEVRMMEARVETKYGVLVIDTYSQCIAGGEENNAAVASAAASAMIRLRRELGITVVFVHHSGKDESRGMRGSDALRANTDGVIEIRRDDSEMTAFAKVARHKDAPIGHGQEFALKVVDIPHLQGQLMSTSLVVEFLAKGERQSRQQVSKAEDLITQISRAMASNPSRCSVGGMCGRIGRTDNRREKEAITDAMPVDVPFVVQDQAGKVIGSMTRVKSTKTNNTYGDISVEVFGPEYDIDVGNHTTH